MKRDREVSIAFEVVHRDPVRDVIRIFQLSDKKPRLKSTKLFKVGENRGATPQMDVQHWRMARIFLDPVVTFDSLEIAEKAGSFLSLSYAVISPWHI